MHCPDCKTQLKTKSFETINGLKVFSNDYAKSWTKENSTYCPQCDPQSYEDLVLFRADAGRQSGDAGAS